MYKMKRIIVHHSASNWGTANDIRKWHLEKGWSDVGYHFVISNGIPTYEDLKASRKFEYMVGQVEWGRRLDADEWIEADEVGAHAYGFNRGSIGICLIHKNGRYPNKMLISLLELTSYLVSKFKIDIKNVVGHCELDSRKPSCPSINMKKLRSDIYSLNNPIPFKKPNRHKKPKFEFV